MNIPIAITAKNRKVVFVDMIKKRKTTGQPKFRYNPVYC